MTNIIKFPGNISHTNYPTTSTYWIRNAFQPKKRKKRKKTRTHTHALIKLHHEQPSLTHQIPLASWPKSWLASTILPPSSSSPVSISIAKFFVLTLNACDTLGRIVDLSPFLPLPPFNDVRNDRQLESQADCLRTTKERGICLTCRLKACRRNEYHSAFLMTCFARLFIWLKRERSRELCWEPSTRKGLKARSRHGGKLGHPIYR